MNTRLVNTAADVILRALTQNRTAAGIALALESAQLLQSPETAAESAHYRAAFEAQRSRAETLDRLLRTAQDRVAELEAALYTEQAHGRTFLEQRDAHAQELLKLRPALREAQARVAALEARLAEYNRPTGAYPPALPWAALLDADDLEGFLEDLVDAASGDDDLSTLTEVESAIARWRAIGEAQHAHNTAPGPDAEELRSCCAGPVCTCTPSSPQDDEHIPPREDDVTPQVEKLRAVLSEDPARCLKTHPFSPRDGWRIVCANCDHQRAASCHEDGGR